MLMVCDAHVLLCVCVSICTHICINKIPNTYHAYSRSVCARACVCVKSNEKKTGKKANKSMKRKQSSPIHFYEKFISMTQFICACTTFAYLLIVLDKSSLQMLSSSFRREKTHVKMQSVCVCVWWWRGGEIY